MFAAKIKEFIISSESRLEQAEHFEDDVRATSMKLHALQEQSRSTEYNNLIRIILRWTEGFIITLFNNTEIKRQDTELLKRLERKSRSETRT